MRAKPEPAAPRRPRPTPEAFTDAVDFVAEMILHLKESTRFSILQACRKTKRLSPTLVSLVLQRKRKITAERADDFARLLKLSVAEKQKFRKLLGRAAPARTDRKDVPVHLLNDWLNAYVKDCFQLPDVSANPKLLSYHLGHIADGRRIDRALEFLLREGYLRRTLDGKIVTDTPLAVADARVPSSKIRGFHKAALDIAKEGVTAYTPTERVANTFLLPLNAENYLELTHLLEEFAEKLQDFAAHSARGGDRLYQIVVHLTPTGGKPSC